MVSKREGETNMVSDLPFPNLVQESNHNEHDAFKGHRKGDITSKVSVPSFTNLAQRSDIDEEPMLIG